MSGHAMLMEFVGDEDGPAPKLKHVSLSPAEARTVYDSLLDEIRLWIANDRIHGDLSPFNILYWNGQATLIDFPQAVNPWDNPDARFLLERDIRNVATWFEPYGIATDAPRIADRLWDAFWRGTL
jgi:RIO kinase 1